MSTNMGDKIELCFSTDLDPAIGYSASEGDQQDTWAGNAPRLDDHKENEATLEKLRIGQRTVAEVVRGLEKVLGYELCPAKILKKDEHTTKIFLDQHRPSTTDVKEANTIYDITDGGLINTSQPEAGVSLQEEDHIYVAFQTPFTKPPSVLVGLNCLYLDRCQTVVGLRATAEQIHSHIFDLYSNTSKDIYFQSAEFTWLAVPTDTHPLLQVGSFDITEDSRRWGLTISFRSPYKSPPKVVVWLRSFDFKSRDGHKAMVIATDITPNGFKVHPQASAGATGFSWFAYPADTPGISSGDLQGTSGIVTFDKPFARPPRRILVALNNLDVANTPHCRFKIIHGAVSTKGMAVRVDTLNAGTLNSAGIAYIAME